MISERSTAEAIVTSDVNSVGKFLLVEQLDDDGCRSRWRAVPGDDASEVLVTLMDPASLGGPEAVARFRAEARLAMELVSPHAARVLDEGVVETTGAPYVVSELLHGQSLADRLARSRLRARDIASYVLQIGDVLSAASNLGIVHRDLRPENVTLVGDPDDEIVKVQDFGVASGAWAASPKVGQAAAARIPGAASYQSPELLRAPKHVDYRSDLWSLAVIAFECLTGRHPFDTQHGTRRSAFSILRAPRPVPSSVSVVPVGFDEWFARATARDIRQRFQTAAELAGSLHVLCCRPELLEPPSVALARPATAAAPGNGGLSAHTGLQMAPGAPSALLPSIRRAELWLLFGAGVLLGLGLVALAVLWPRHGHVPAPDVVPVEAIQSLSPAPPP